MNMAVSIPNNVHTGGIISFRNNKKGTDKFKQGYVQSSQLYRREVYPFLTDAARAVYFELENHINGYQKETAHVSYSQLSGLDLDGARQLSRSTISKGLYELLEKGVITLISKCYRRGNKYQINEISLVEKQHSLVHETNCTSTRGELLAVHETNTTKKEKEIFKENKKKDWFDFKKLEKHVSPQNNSISVEQLKNAHWFEYEFERFEEYNANKEISDGLKHSYLATWLLKANAKYQKTAVHENKHPRVKPKVTLKSHIMPVSEEKSKIGIRVAHDKEDSIKAQNRDQKQKSEVCKAILTLKQIRLFAKKLANYSVFASKHAETGEELKAFETRLVGLLCNPSYVQKHLTDLKAVGYATQNQGGMMMC